MQEFDDCPREADWVQIAKDIECPAIIISACRRSGKTYLTRDILHKMGPIYKWDVAILFSETADFNSDFDYIPEQFKYNHLDQDLLGKFIEQQEKTMKQHKAMKKRNKSYDKEPSSVLVIFDDVAHDKKVFHSEKIGKLFILGRHIKMSVIFLTQHLHALAPKFRNNADVICTFRDPNWHNRKCLEEGFCTLSVANKKLVQKYIDTCLGEAYKCVVICMYKVQQASKMNDYIYTYKAPEGEPQFKLGQKVFWSKSKQSLNSTRKQSLKLDTDYEKRFVKDFGERLLKD